MKIARAEIFSYTLPLVAPLPVRNTTITERNGLVLRLTSDTGEISLGEAAPLPGYSEEDFDQALVDLSNACTTLRATEIDDTWSPPPNLCGSARFAIESGLVDLVSQRQRILFHRALNPDARDIVFVNALVSANDPDCIAIAQRVVSAGYRAVKVKVGRIDPALEARTIRQLREAVGDDVTVSLDANRAWDVDTAIQFANRIADLGVSYIEEPVKHFGDLAQYAANTDVPTALDESLRHLDPSSLILAQGVSALVIKPTILGLKHAMLWASAARKAGVRVAASACFESGLGVSRVASFAAAIGDTTSFAGLDTYAWLANDILASPRLDLTAGKLNVVEAAWRIDGLRRELPKELIACQTY